MTSIPGYGELPYNDVLRMRNSWGVFGADDQLGALNRVTFETRRAAVGEVKSGESFGLGLPLHWPDPPLFGREAHRHEIFPTGRTGYDDRLLDFYPQGSSQWDGFRHVRAREFGLYGGDVEAPVPGEPDLGIQHWAERGIVTRGVLIDAARYLTPFDPFGESRVSVAEIRAIADAERVGIRPGDVLLFRFGWTAAYKQLDERGRRELSQREVGCWAGLRPDEEMAAALWNWGVAAVAADNPALECAPGSRELGSLHRRLLPMLGIPIGELFDLDALADACSRDDRYSFLFAAAPLPLVGGVGSPANALAIR